MSETTPNTPSAPSANGLCEQLLDYVYGELDEAKRRTFEEHLPGCARCQAEVASFGRVRTAVKRVMPSVEPPAQLTGGLHAQLLHAAAQRKPRRGALLAFPRKLVEHPAWAAAAMFVVVGGAIAINWSHGKLAMPEASAPANAPQLEPQLAPQLAPPKLEVATPVVAEKSADELVHGGALKDSTQLSLQMPIGKLAVQEPKARRTVTVSTNEAAPAKMKAIAVRDEKSGKLMKADDDGELADVEGGGLGGVKGDVVGGSASGAVGGGGFGRGATADSAKSSAPATLAKEEQSKNGRNQAGYLARAPMPAPVPSLQQAPAAPPPPPAAAATASSAPERESTSFHSKVAKQQAAPLPQPVQSSGGDIEALHKRFNDAARASRYEEAVKLFGELEKRSQYVTPTERALYVRCLMATGRQDRAQQALDELKADKRLSNAQLQQVESELGDARRRSEPAAKKAAKKPMAAPADRAAQQQQRAAEPAPASPTGPDSTNTKIQKSY